MEEPGGKSLLQLGCTRRVLPSVGKILFDNTVARTATVFAI
jgi:hypothetical protein